MTGTWAGPEPGGAGLDQLAEQSVRAAETHGIPSREHDNAMGAWADAAADAEAEAG